MRLLLNFLLHHFMFGATMFFAAGTTALTGGDTGASGGDIASGGGDTGGGDGDGADTGGDAGDGAAAADGDTQAAGDGADDAQGDTQQATGDELVEGEDGRKIPAKYKEIFKQDKFLKGLFFENKALKQNFPGGVKEAIQAKQTIEQFGGAEGLKEVQSEVTDFRAVDKMFMEGSPELVERLAQANPESFVKLVQTGLEKFAALDKETYEHTLGRVVFNTLREAEALHGAYNLLSSLKDNPEAKQMADALRQWYEGIHQIATKVPEKKVDLQQKKLDEQRQQLEQKEADMHVRGINSQALPKLVTSIESALAAEMKGRGIKLADLKKSDPETYSLLVANCMQAVKNEVLSDKSYVQNYEATLAERSPQKALKMIDGKHAKVIPAAVARVYRHFVGAAGVKSGAQNTQRRQTNAAQGGGNAAGFMQVAEKPDRFAIDWNLSRDLMLESKAILKNGKKVTWATK